MPELEKIANEADMIVNGYAFKSENGNIRILNLNNPKKALVLSSEEKILETTMDDIEIHIVQSMLEKNREFLEVKSA